MALAQVIIMANQVESARIGHQAISLTHYSDNLEPAIAAGSVVEVGGALYEAAADEAITGLAAIAPSSDVYIKLTVAGASVTASGTIVAPTWSTSKQGWYSGTERYIFALYKDAGGNYINKRLLLPLPMQQSKELLLNQLTVPAAALLSAFTAATGSNTCFAADAERTSSSATYEKVKAISIPFSGTVNVAFDLKRIGGTAFNVYGRIYKNGAAVGTERTTTSTGYVNFTEDIAVARGDVLELYIKIGDASVGARNFRVRTSTVVTGTLLELLTGPVLN